MPRLAACLLLCLALPAGAADWVMVAHDKLRSVEIDRASVMDADAGSKVAWGRIVLSDAQAAKTGYKSVHALNRYDCRNRSFTIVKRSYRSDDDRPLREESVDADKATPVRPGTVDERFFTTVCPQAAAPTTAQAVKPAKSNLYALAREAARAAAATQAGTHDDSSFRRADLHPTKTEVPSSEGKPANAVESGRATRTKGTREAASPAADPAPALPAPSFKSYHDAPPPSYTAKPVAPRAPKSTPHPVVKPEPHPVLQAPAPRPNWSYESSTGPEFWGTLAPENSLCRNGQRQSPIDIRDGIPVDQEPLGFDYQRSYFRILDTGHTIQVSYGAGSYLTAMGRRYELTEIQFHHPAEERIAGKGFDMVAHLVHRDPSGKLAIVAVLLEAGAANPLIQTLWNSLPLEQGDELTPQTAIQIADLLPARREYYSYMGSLTTPPCSEGVLWLVFKQPVQLSAEQIAVFSRFYAHNARPLQPANGRIIKESR